jgi:hypothetical protein
MRIFCLLFAIVAPAGEVYVQGPVAPNSISPTLDHGYLMVYGPGLTFAAFGPDGLPLFTAAASVPKTDWTQIVNVSADSDGSVAAAVEYAKGGKMIGAGIARFDQAGSQIWFIDTGRNWPTHVAFGPDHSIWALGWRGPQDSGNDDFLLRHYGADGQDLGGFLPRNSFDAEPSPTGTDVGAHQLFCSNSRVGAILYRQRS